MCCITVECEVSSLLCVSGLGFLSRTSLHLCTSPFSNALPSTDRKPKPPFGASWLCCRGAAAVVCTWVLPSLSVPSLPTLFWKSTPYN